MKKLITSGLIVALGWLANGAGAQEIQWRASPAKNVTPATITTTSPDTGVRAVSVGRPTPLDGVSSPVIRAQSAEDKTVPAIPRLEVIAGDKQKEAKPMPKDKGFTPPPPSPVFGPLGLDDCSPCGDVCGPLFARGGCCPERPRFWASAEYLLWWQRAQNTPPLITSSPGGQVGGIGVIGDPRTTILYDEVPNNMRSGGRFAGGMWMPHFCCNVGVEVGYFFLGRQRTSSVFESNGDPQLARPFFDAELAAQDAEIFTPGRATINTFSQLWGIEGNIRHKWLCGPRHWVDFFWGYRYLNLSEGIDISEDLSIPLVGAAPLQIIESESFRTRTNFNGGQIGLEGECRLWNRCFVGWRTKLAMGVSSHIINIDGSTTFVAPAPFGTVTQQGALLATPTNIGRYTDNRFAVVPEVGLKLGVDVTNNLRLFVGYDFLYWSNVVRPGDQIDLNVAPSFRPTILGPGVGGGPRVPAVLFNTTDYWAQGFNFGLQYRY